MANSVADSFWLTVLFFLVHVDRTKNNTDAEGERERERRKKMEMSFELSIVLLAVLGLVLGSNTHTNRFSMQSFYLR